MSINYLPYCIVNNEQTLITSIYEPKTLSETMNDQQSYYETMYILRPDIAEDEVTNHIDKYNKLLEEFGGTILDSQMRGKRRLAYQIAKNREGIYVQLSHQGDGQHIFKIEKAMRLGEDVIRYLTVKQEGPLPTPRVSNKTTNEAEKKGCMTIDGTYMLVAQGAKSLSFWTNGLEAPFEIMHEALKNVLDKKN